MFDLFKFSLPLTITQHLIGKLEDLSPTSLTKKDLEDLRAHLKMTFGSERQVFRGQPRRETRAWPVAL